MASFAIERSPAPGDRMDSCAKGLIAPRDRGIRHVSLGADLTVAEDQILGCGQLPQSHGAAGVQLLGADADLGTEAELLAVGEPGGHVHHDRGGVDLALKALGCHAGRR